MKALVSTLSFIARHPLSKGRVARNLARYFCWQIGSRLVPGPVAVSYVNAAKLLVQPGMTGATGNVYVGLHEFNDMAFVAHFLRPDELFVDVGANVGSYTILAGSGVGAHCIAFEPDPKAFEWLRRNVDLNGISANVEMRQEALGSGSGHVSFTVGRDTVNHVVLDQQQTDDTRLVAMTTLDDALAGRTPVMIKIDVEGFETDVISGARAAIKNPHLSCVLMELNGAGRRYGFDETALRRFMAEQGFQEYSYQPFERRLVPFAPTSNNTLFIRNAPHARQRLAEAGPISVLGRAF